MVVVQDEESEEALLNKAQAGNAEAFCGLVRLHQARVHLHLAYQLGRKDVVDDLAQEVFLIAYRQLAEFRGESPFHLWLLGIARNRVWKHLRTEARSKRGQERTIEAALAEWRLALGEGAATDVDPRDHEFAALRRCIENLPGTSSELVAQHYFQRRSLVQIAEALGKKTSAVRMTLLRTRQALRECVQRRLADESGLR